MNHPFRLALVLLLGMTSAPVLQAATPWDLFQNLDWESRQAYLDTVPVPASWDEAFLRQALDLTDGSRIESGTDTEVAVKKAVAVKLVRLLADRSAVAATSAIARLPGQYKDPVLRGEAWLALAKLGDKTSIPAMVRTLATLNDSGQRARGEEIQASYLIQALGLLKAPEAFRAVAAASLGWYTPASGVRTLAKKTLPTLAADFEKTALEFLANDEDLSFREGLFLSLADQGDPGLTGRAAAALLPRVVRTIPHDQEDRDRAFRVTLEALLGAQKAPAPPASLVPSLQLLLSRNDNNEELVQSVRLLAKIKDPTAVTLLIDTLTKYNAQQKAGTNRTRDLDLVKELFLALGQTGSATARAVLDEARFSNYTPALTRDAVEAFEKLPRE